MSGTKTVILEPQNHEYLKNLAFINDSSIQKEVNLIIEKKRAKEVKT